MLSCSSNWPGANRNCRPVRGGWGWPRPEPLGEWVTLTQLLVQIEQYGRKFRPDIYGLDHAQLMGELKPRSGLVGRFTSGLSGRYRVARKAVQAQALDGARLSGGQAYEAVEMAQRLVEAWRSSFPWAQCSSPGAGGWWCFAAARSGQ